MRLTQPRKAQNYPKLIQCQQLIFAMPRMTNCVCTWGLHRGCLHCKLQQVCFNTLDENGRCAVKEKLVRLMLPKELCCSFCVKASARLCRSSTGILAMSSSCSLPQRGPADSRSCQQIVKNSALQHPCDICSRNNHTERAAHTTVLEETCDLELTDLVQWRRHRRKGVRRAP